MTDPFDPASFEAFDTVEPVFQATVDRLGDAAFEPDALARQPAAVRMLVATRAVEGQVDNGGWPAVFYNAVDGLLPFAIDGYRLLGLDDHADLAQRIGAHGFDLEAEEDDVWQAFEEEWAALPSAERARAAFIRGHAPDFG
jgi:hypothetical protein